MTNPNPSVGKAGPVEPDADVPTVFDRVVFIVAFAASIVGGLILAVTFVFTIPDGLVAVGGLLFLLGLICALIIGFREGRRDGRSLTRSVGRGLRVLWSWLWAFMP